ncbi:MAG: DUF2059 domain-containing protein [Acidobacteriaceae bacterium]
MKFITRILLALFLFAPLAAHAETPSSKQAKAEELLQLTHMDHMMTQMLDQLSARMKSTADEQAANMHMTPKQKIIYDDYQQKLNQLLAGNLTWDKMKPIMVQVYSNTYTDQELDGILNFYRSPAGQAMVAKSPELMTKTRTAMMDRMGSLQSQVQQLSKDLGEKMQQAAAPATPAPAK